MTDIATLRDLDEFVRLEKQANDIEPWAEIIKALHLDEESSLWLLKLYNSYDDIGSAWRVASYWPSPADWAAASDHSEAVNQPISRERRNLYGGKVVRHLDAYVAALEGRPQRDWIEQVLGGSTPFDDFRTLIVHLRTVWGIGRQSAFEWAEFIAKVQDYPIEPPDALLWESSGPRESLERIYFHDRFVNMKRTDCSLEELNAVALDCKQQLSTPLSWWDFETVICDFNVMRKGRYYPGKHVAMLRGEVEASPHLLKAFNEVIPKPWSDIPAGADKDLMVAYQQTGKIKLPEEVLSWAMKYPAATTP